MREFIFAYQGKKGATGPPGRDCEVGPSPGTNNETNVSVLLVSHKCFLLIFFYLQLFMIESSYMRSSLAIVHKSNAS